MDETVARAASASALLTDLYQLTMAAAYRSQGLADRPAVFHHVFRSLPFGGGFAIAAGLGPLIEYIEGFRFQPDELAYLRTLKADGRPLFAEDFLEHLAQLRLQFDIDAVPEGTVVFPHEPLVRVRGPLMHCQLLETALLNGMNFQTLVATKAARVYLAAQGDSVLEFGLRRAQGPDGGVSATRASYVGGCNATSNVLAGQRYGIPVVGTHSHSWVMAFDSEADSFRAYARAMPQNCVFLVDTYETIQGVRRAIEVGREIRQRGLELRGIRLDSGDLVALSIATRKLLDEAGFERTQVIASGDLDEHVIADCKRRGARIDVWGVGTKLAVAKDDPALGGVYKLAAIGNGTWEPRLKLSDDAVKTSNPGIHQVRRFSDQRGMIGDLVYDVLLGPSPQRRGTHVLDGRPLEFPSSAANEDLLVPIYRHGKLVYDVPSLTECRERTIEQLGLLPEPYRVLTEPAVYPVGLDERLQTQKDGMMRALRDELAQTQQAAR